MPRFNVDHHSSLSASEAFERIRRLSEGDAELKRLDPSIKCAFKEDEMSGKLTTDRFSADIAVKPNGSGSVVSLSVDLPLLLTPFVGRIRETLEDRLKQYLA
jgi:hypothetical protein